MASTYLTRTPSGSGNQRTFTFSFWVKRSGLSSQQHIYCQSYGSEDYQFRMEFTSSDEFRLYNSKGASDAINLKTNRKFRDTSSWYAITIAIDTTQGTEANRAKIYVNGVQETSFATATYPTQNLEMDANAGVAQLIGVQYKGNYDRYFDGSLSHFHFIEATQYQASDFGETDSTSGIWKPKTAPSVTYGTNGYFLKMENSGAMGTDSSGNSNTFTVSGTLTQNVDTPSNNFATMNTLIRSSNGTFASGNNKFTTSGGAWGSGFATLGMFNGGGKYYMEFKGASGTKIAYGISDFKSSGVIQRTEAGETRYCGEYANSYAYHYGGNFYYSGSSTSTGYDSFTSSNVIGMAVDMDNLKIYFHKDGNYQDSKNPASNNGYTIVAPEGVYLPTITVEDAGATVNFGNGVFDTTAVASAGTAPSGGGIFEHDCPSGYQALCTKGINSF